MELIIILFYVLSTIISAIVLIDSRDYIQKQIANGMVSIMFGWLFIVIAMIKLIQCTFFYD